ncbi:MAG: Bcr/CflA family efflux MFS transporter [Desulfovibrio sp.]|nr:MAG: Bcr/CflA family efflux MFS transporter [Desulfovibrio sp.]
MTQRTSHTRLLLLLALLVAFPPLSIDMYLPALPQLQETWQQPLSLVNLTLIGFFAAYGLFLLVYGPLSDRLGRRPPMLAGIALYILGSGLCALAQGVTALIVFRIVQAAGAASASAIAMAVTKDKFAGHERERILAYIGVIMALAPMLAPTLGGWIMAFASWRWIFLVQALIGVVGGIGVWRMEESLKHPSTANPLQVALTYVELLGNARYVCLVLLVSGTSVAHFCFIGSSSDIYIKGFGLSEQTFGYFFALNASALMAGLFLYTRLQRLMETRLLLSLAFAGIVLGCVAMLFNWLPGPWRLAVPMFFASLAFGVSRPPSNNLILEQVDRHAGAASSLMVFTFFTAGALVMWLVSLGWEDVIGLIGALGAVAGSLVLLIWLLVPKRFFFQHSDPAPEKGEAA